MSSRCLGVALPGESIGQAAEDQQKGDNLTDSDGAALQFAVLWRAAGLPFVFIEGECSELDVARSTWTDPTVLEVSQ